MNGKRNIILAEQEYYDMLDRTYWDGVKTGAFVLGAFTVFFGWVIWVLLL